MRANQNKTDNPRIPLKVYFCNPDHPDYLEIHVFEHMIEGLKLAQNLMPENPPPDDTKFAGVSIFNCESTTDKKADIIFIKQYLDLPLIVHECQHAAFDWCNEHVKWVEENFTDNLLLQVLEYVKAETLDEYYTEMLAHVTASLVDQVLALLGFIVVPRKEPEWMLTKPI